MHAIAQLVWAWANFHMLERVRSRIVAVRDYGEQEEWPRLTVPKWPATQVDGWAKTAIAAYVLDARGASRTPYGEGFTYFLITGIRHAQ